MMLVTGDGEYNSGAMSQTDWQPQRRLLYLLVHTNYPENTYWNLADNWFGTDW